MNQEKEAKDKSADSQTGPQPAAEAAAMRTSALPLSMMPPTDTMGSIGMTGWGPGGGPAPSMPGTPQNAGPGGHGMYPAYPPSPQPPYYNNGGFYGGGVPYGWPYGMPFNPNLVCSPYYNGYGWGGWGGGWQGNMMMPHCPPVMPQQHRCHGGGHHGHSMCGCRPSCCRRPPCACGCGCR